MVTSSAEWKTKLAKNFQKLDNNPQEYHPA
jgi:hypothetical protein